MTRYGTRGILLVAAAWCAAVLPAVPADPHEVFPLPAGLEGHVAFWESVFAIHDRDEVVVHDMDYPGLVYEVFDLPGPMEDRYTDEQDKLVEALREDWEDRLIRLRDALDSGRELSDEHKELALGITTAAGTGGIRDAHKRVRTQRGLRSRFKRGLEMGNRYDALFRQIFKAEGLPEDLVALPHVESSYQPMARSSAGAAGVWQFTRSTGRQFLSIDARLDERYDPVASAEGAARFLAAAYDKLQDWPLAITSYNHGVNGMRRARSRFGTDIARIVYEYRSRHFGFASRNFYAEFLAARMISSDPARYFPEGLAPEPPMEEEAVVLDRSHHVSDLAALYGVPLKELVGLNPAWTRRTVHGVLALKSGTRVWLPAGALERRARGDIREVDLTPPGLPPSEYHTVARGENLSVIAREYGMTVSQLRQLNDMGPRETRIYAGEKLLVTGPVNRSRYHTVVRGDTLSGIARAYRVSLSALLRSNRLTLRSVIRPGQRLTIPLS